MNLLYLSWKNLISKPLSTLLSLLLLALGVGLVSILLLITTQIEDKFDKNQAGVEVIIGAKGSPLQLMLSSLYHIDNPTGNISIQEFDEFRNSYAGKQYIKEAIPVSTGDNYQGHRIIGTTHGYCELYKAELAEGKLWEKTYEVTIGSLIAQRFNLSVGDTIYSAHGLMPTDDIHTETPFTIVGILKRTGAVIDQLLLVNTETVWGVHDTPDMETPREVTAMLIKCRSMLGRLALPRIVAKKTNMQASVPAMEMTRLYTITGVGEEALRWLAWIIIIVSGLSIFISLFSSLKERRYELALMRVMGSSPIKLFVLIILEGVLLSIVGYLLGIGLSHLGMSLLAGSLSESYQYDFSNSLLIEEAYILVGALVVGIIAAFIPALQASRTDISTTLSRS